MLTGPQAFAFDFFGGNPNEVCNKQTSGSPVCTPVTTNDNPIVTTIQVATSIVALIAGFLAVLMIIIAGFQFVTSGGNDETVKNARRRIQSSIIGLIIIATSWTIIRFVTDQLL